MTLRAVSESNSVDYHSFNDVPPSSAVAVRVGAVALPAIELTPQLEAIYNQKIDEIESVRPLTSKFGNWVADKTSDSCGVIRVVARIMTLVVMPIIAVLGFIYHPIASMGSSSNSQEEVNRIDELRRSVAELPIHAVLHDIEGARHGNGFVSDLLTGVIPRINYLWNPEAFKEDNGAVIGEDVKQRLRVDMQKNPELYLRPVQEPKHSGGSIDAVGVGGLLCCLLGGF